MNDGDDFDSLVQGYHFWTDEVESVRRRTLAQDGKKYRYFDDKGIFNFVFFIWIYKWVKTVAERYLDPYMLHPLPLADQILIWQPILSKHISDGIASLEAYETLVEENNDKKPVRYILWRAIVLTFWKRLVGILVTVVVMNAIGTRVAIYLHRLLHLLSEGHFGFLSFLLLALSIILMELVKDIGMYHINYYVSRLQIVMDSTLRIVVFQHGLCYRRNRFLNFSDSPNSCKSIIHNCSGEDACTDNPLLCPARRYKNNEVTPKMYALVLNDSHYIPYAVECASGLVDFLTTFTYGLILISSQFNMRAMTILIVSLSLVTCMILVEVINGFVFKYYIGIRDNRISKSEEVISGLHLIERMALDDIGHDIITEARNDELLLVIIRFFISLINKVIFTAITCLDIIILVNDFVTQVRDTTDVKSIDPSGLLASIFIIMKIVGPLYTLSFRLELLMITINASRRLELFFRTCSPNFYLQDNKFTGRNPLPEALPDKNKTLPKGLVVMFKKASFAWVNSRKDLLDNTGTTCLRNLDFVLNTGDLAIITGAQGSGKTNFVKAILGDMTLVEGSMAVLPLSTNMPIFYASQEVWLQKGTIRANITFGHRFDEDIYNTVLKAIELEHDISTWEGGDLRKISEHGYSLSGGQRVRIGLARAIYAYLIFSKVTRESESDHSFLVVIDDCFTGLDPFVARTIFKNLFDNGKGLLSGRDAATVLTITKRVLDTCVSSELPDSFPDAPIYTLRNKTLVHENMLRSFTDNKIGDLEVAKISDYRVELKTMSNYIRRNCLSDDYSRSKRREIVESKYTESPTAQALHNCNNVLSVKDSLRSYKVYFRAAGLPIILFFVLTIIFATLDNTKFIITSRISDSVLDYTRGYDGNVTSLEDIRSYCTKILGWVTVISEAVMIGALLRIIAMAKASFNVSRKTHEYCVNSLFANSSAVLNIKKSLSAILTFLYMDTLFIDNSVGYFIHEACLSLIESNVHLLTLLFMIPWSAPLVIILLLVILKLIAQYFFKACRKIGFARLESFCQMDSVIESAISGLPLYRSFKKEWELVYNMIEHVDYNLRCNYLSRSIITGSSIAFRCLFSPLALFILLFPLIRSRYFGAEIRIGYYGMAYSIFISLNSSFSNFLGLYSYLESSVMSVRRFESFVPPNTLVVFDRKRDINRTDIIVDRVGRNTEFLCNIENSIVSRRCFDYISRRSINLSGFRILFFNHHVNILDVSKYTIPGVTRIKLDNVNVHIFNKKTGMKYAILKNITCSANTSDIIGVIGRTGAGKSTLLSVLQNLAENREGSVLLDGCDLNDMPKNVTRQIIGVLPQLPFVFRGWTVRRFIDPRMLFEDVDINTALDNCGLLKFVENLSGGKGLDTVIIPDHYHKDMPRYYKRVYYGPTLKPHDASSADNVNIDYGSALSNSQLRTLSVARLVLYREFFKVLLVDEPPEDELGAYNTAETPIYELIKTHFQHCTTFIAAHDSSVLRFCTSVWVFHKGSLIRTCKTEDIVDTGSLSKIIEDCISEEN
ncbi:ABC transporter, ATP-binding protein domain containing protein [Theileria equi strain WA]|uniref:ABC transporter, ATP-binding protein domain containing protein n=1 Tax=Theileria equi strain WA TaxID=1537102 RepID=L1LGU1_THEEQ|nr:ABC transporter, ATP-binding protein domain containing protein [Theileria equi strain WA]EKX74338.1 ABC transporter, ATP-binding protein domain containing protein [Theileria equi strain WA]|eukprot:XP_004833790.1 ABC transporter, ATP-binding protein domain containing protein [Theileria equi strain WA]